LAPIASWRSSALTPTSFVPHALREEVLVLVLDTVMLAKVFDVALTLRLNFVTRLSRKVARGTGVEPATITRSRSLAGVTCALENLATCKRRELEVAGVAPPTTQRTEATAENNGVRALRPLRT
jgi:hypothetical protein